MSDNIFDRLFELFQTTDSVNWRLAAEITESVAGTPEPIEPHLAEEYEELALPAQLRLADAGLDVGGAVVPHPIDPSGWAKENHRSFGYLIEPLSAAMGQPAGDDPHTALLSQIGPALLGMQAGSMVGFMSHRVMGQFDTALPPLDGPRPYLVVPNVEAFATEHDLDARQVRLWATLHELVQITLIGDPALREYLSGRVREIYAGLDFDPSRIMERLNDLQDPAQVEEVLSDSGGLAALLGGEPRPEPAADLQNAGAFIEGYGDYMVRQAGGDLLPGLGDIESAHRTRRAEPGQAIGQLAHAFGFEIDRSRADVATGFCEDIARRWGPEVLDSFRESPDHLPRRDELTDPVGWAARILLE